MIFALCYPTKCSLYIGVLIAYMESTIMTAVFTIVITQGASLNPHGPLVHPGLFLVVRQTISPCQGTPLTDFDKHQISWVKSSAILGAKWLL